MGCVNRIPFLAPVSRSHHRALPACASCNDVQPGTNPWIDDANAIAIFPKVNRCVIASAEVRITAIDAAQAIAVPGMMVESPMIIARASDKPTQRQTSPCRLRSNEHGDHFERIGSRTLSSIVPASS